MVIASKDQLLEFGGAGDVGAFTNVNENGGCLLGHCSFLPPLALMRRRLGEGLSAPIVGSTLERYTLFGPSYRRRKSILYAAILLCYTPVISVHTGGCRI